MSIVDEIEGVLREEQDLLLSGDLAGLEALVERKLRLTEALANVRPDLPEDAYRDLQAKASRNEALLGAAQRGLQAALAQLRQIGEAQDQTTYARDGQRHSLSLHASSITEKF